MKAVPNTPSPTWCSLARQEHSEIDLEIKKSHFLGQAARTDDDAAARAFINQVRSNYPDARHHCSAYLISPPDSNPLERSSDDGEPSGTAGSPILEAIRSSGLVNVTVVVTRYFGGTLLGTGGLVRAYSTAAQQALSVASKTALETYRFWQITLPAASAGRFEAELRARKYRIEEVTWSAEVTLTVSIPVHDQTSQQSLFELLAAFSQGDVTPILKGEHILETPLCV